MGDVVDIGKRRRKKYGKFLSAERSKTSLETMVAECLDKVDNFKPYDEVSNLYHGIIGLVNARTESGDYMSLSEQSTLKVLYTRLHMRGYYSNLLYSTPFDSSRENNYN